MKNSVKKSMQNTMSRYLVATASGILLLTLGGCAVTPLDDGSYRHPHHNGVDKRDWNSGRNDDRRNWNHNRDRDDGNDRSRWDRKYDRDDDHDGWRDDHR
ncbi:MAG: hypothetical protein EOO69_06115 [Moraxellaceae bacterium]|nr:MAG: hypothetical protein EOO69_06115 [Moraxellaceae bacterium]